ncbi:MAG TPA: GNAT family N-acetyltransferase [Steroidobacteraceae bacterium]|nr:GNAT family N-acetyltransferase [Steroidobacteraceae bacterium]
MAKIRLETVFRPGSLALIGASDTPGTLGDLVRRNLEDGGYAGVVHFVSTSHEQIGGKPVFKSVLDLPKPVDAAVIVTPAPTVPGLLADCAKRGIRGAIVVSGGFREIGEEGRGLEQQIRKVVREGGIRVLGTNSLGVVRTESRMNAACGPAMPLPGRMALVSQSGALCSAMLDWARLRHIGFSTVISTGHATDVDVSEILDFLVRDSATDSIVLFMESVGNARRFMSALRAAARVKPVVVMKAGRHADRTDAAAFHTGALVGGDDVFDAAMRRAGVLRINSFYDLLNAAATLGAGVRVRGRRIAIVSNAGGPGAMAADHVMDRSLKLATLSPKTLEDLRAMLPAGAELGNPFYLRGEATAEQFATATRMCFEDPGVEEVLAILTPHATTQPETVAKAVIEVASKTRKPLFTCWLGGDSVADSRARFAEHRVPSYTTPEAAVDAIAALALFAANQEQLLQVAEPLDFTSQPDRSAVQAVIDAALDAGQDWLDPAESAAVLAAFGIPVLRSLPARSAEEAVGIARAVGFPVVMKVLSPDIAHKTDVGGVRLGLTDAAAVTGAYRAVLESAARMRPDAQIEGVLLEPVVRHRGGRELMIGAVRDPVFGPAISFGLGGTMVEVIRDRAVALPPLNRFLVEDLIRRTRAGLALQPLRGAPAADAAAVEEILLRISELVCEVPSITAMDLNPVVVSAEGALVLDARLGIRRVEPGRRAYAHMAIHPYPSGLVRRIELAGDVKATIRPIRPEDAAIESAFVHGLSEQSKFLRFMFALHDLAPEMLSRFTQIDYDRELALIGVIDTPEGEKQIGVARYITLEDEETCEFAIVVADEWQGKGLARQIFAALIEAARGRSLKVMNGITLRENTRMLELARANGFTLHTDADDPSLVEMRLRLQPQ